MGGSRRQALRGILLLAATVGLGACAADLRPPTAERPPTRCTDDDACLAQGRAAFERYRAEKVAAIEAADGGYRLPGAPEALLHPHRTEYSALLVHGLNDSAYYMRDIARLLYAQGFNTVSILLPGHGTRPEDMRAATAEAWRAEVRRGLEMAALVGRRVTMGGFSLGADLSIDAVLRGADVHGLFLFAPPVAFALDVFQVFGSLTCLPGIRSIIIETALPPNPVKYKHRTANGACQTYRVTAANVAAANAGQSPADPHLDKIRRIGARITVPTFVGMTFADARVDPDAVLAFAYAIRAPVVLATFGPPERWPPRPGNGFRGRVVHVSDAPLAHSYLILHDNPYNGQQNPAFDDLKALLAEHVRRNFGGPGHERPGMAAGGPTVANRTSVDRAASDQGSAPPVH